MKDLIDVAAGLQAFCEERGGIENLRPLAEVKEEPEIMDRLEALRQRYANR